MVGVYLRPLFRKLFLLVRSDISHKTVYRGCFAPVGGIGYIGTQPAVQECFSGLGNCAHEGHIRVRLRTSECDILCCSLGSCAQVCRMGFV